MSMYKYSAAMDMAKTPSLTHAGDVTAVKPAEHTGNSSPTSKTIAVKKLEPKKKCSCAT